MIEDGVVAELLLGRKYGHRLHFWDLRRRRHVQTLDLGDEHQMTLELRPAHDPTKPYGFVGVVVSRRGPVRVGLALAPRRRPLGGHQGARRSRPSRPTRPSCRRRSQPFGAVPPLVTDIDLSVDDQFLYVSCWGTGELQQYDVSRPVPPAADRLGRLGGIVGRAAHPPSRHAARRRPADGRGQPRRPAGLRHQLAVRLLGRPVLPGRRRRLDGQAGRRRRTADSRFDERFFPHGDELGAGCGRTRSASRAATPPPTRTATRDQGARPRQPGAPRPGRGGRAAGGRGGRAAVRPGGRGGQGRRGPARRGPA